MAKNAAERLADLCPHWEGKFPGARVPCSSPLIGRSVALRSGRGRVHPAEVLGCTAPIEMPSAKREKLSARRRCEGGFEVRFTDGLDIRFAVPKSKVRERMREREGLCPDALVIDPHSGFVEFEEREARKRGVQPFVGGELPFPHRLGSTPCCRNSSVYPDKVEEAFFEAKAGRGFVDREDVVVMAQKMIPKGLRSEVSVEAFGDVPAALVAVREHCWNVVRHWESAKQRTAKFSAARELAAERRAIVEAAELGETRARQVGLGHGRRRVEAGWTDVADLAKKGRRKKAAINYFKVG